MKVNMYTVYGIRIYIYMLQRHTPPLPPAMVMVGTPPPPVDLWWLWVGVLDG